MERGRKTDPVRLKSGGAGFDKSMVFRWAKELLSLEDKGGRRDPAVAIEEQMSKMVM